MADPEVVGTTGPVQPRNDATNTGEGAIAPRPTPPVTEAEAPDVTPSVSDVLSGTTSPEVMARRVQRPGSVPQTFLGGAQAALGRGYVTDANGNLVPRVQTDKYGNPVKTTISMRGILGGILAGVAQGALGGMSAERKPGENPYAAGARGALQLEKERDDRAKALAQRNFENRQKQQAMNIEQAKQMDEHTTRLLTNAKITQETIALEHESRYMDEMRPLLLQDQREKLDAAITANRKNFDDLRKQLVEAVGPEAVELPGAGHSVLTPDHARDAARGTGPMYGTEGHGGEFGYGIVDYESLENSPLKKDVSVYRNVIDPKTGAVSKELMTTLKAGEPAYKALDLYNAGMDQFYQQYKIYADGLEAQAKQAEIPLKKAEAAKDIAEAGKARAEASALGNAPGGPIDTQAQALVEANMDPSQLSKRGNTYGPILAAATKYSLEKYGKPYDIEKATSDYKFATNPGTQNTLKYLNSLTGADNRSGNLGTLLQYSDRVARTDFPALNDAAAWGRLQVGDPAISNYHTAVVEVADQVAKILQGGGTGNGTSDAKLQQAQELFRSGFSKDAIRGVAQTLRDLLANRKKELIGDNRYLQKQYNVAPTTQTQQNVVPPGKVAAYNKTTGQIVGYADDNNGTNFHRF